MTQSANELIKWIDNSPKKEYRWIKTYEKCSLLLVIRETQIENTEIKSHTNQKDNLRK